MKCIGIAVLLLAAQACGAWPSFLSPPTQAEFANSLWRFEQMDSDHDGRLSLAELRSAAPRLAEQFETLDRNHDGWLTRDELRAAQQAEAQRARANEDENLAAADGNGDGKLSREEMERSGLRIARHFNEIDINHDNSLSYEEIRMYLQASRWAGLREQF